MMYNVKMDNMNKDSNDCQVIQKIMKEEEEWLKKIIDSKTNSGNFHKVL